MANRGSWFFDGYQAHYETDENGRKKKVLTYTGERYGIRPLNLLKRIKVTTVILTVLLLAILLLIQLFPGTGGMLPWVGAPCMWALVPGIFLCIGVFNFLLCGESWEVRQYYSGYRRIRRCAWWILILMTITSIGHVAFLIIWPMYFPSEAYYPLGSALCCLLAAALLRIQHKYPAIVVEGPIIH